MIVKQNKSAEMTPAYPNSNPYENEDNYVVDETTPEGQALADKIMQCAPYMDLVVVNGRLVDVTPTERPPEPAPEPTPEQKIAQLESDNLTSLEAIAEVYEMVLALQTPPGGTPA